MHGEKSIQGGIVVELKPPKGFDRYLSLVVAGRLL